MVADNMTKPLNTRKKAQFVRQLGICVLPTQAIDGENLTARANSLKQKEKEKEKKRSQTRASTSPAD